MFHATELFDHNERLCLTEPCRSPIPTSCQRILRHGFSSSSGFIPNQNGKAIGVIARFVRRIYSKD